MADEKLHTQLSHRLFATSRSEMRINMKSISRYLEEDKEKWANLPYLSVKKQDSYVTHTFSEVVTDVQALARALLREGVSGNIMIYAGNSYEWMIADLAILAYVGVCIPVDREWTAFDLCHILSVLTVNTILYEKDKKDVILTVQKTYPQIRFLCIEDCFPAFLNTGSILSKPLHGNGDRNQTAMILFTSGTTSRPKAIPLTQTNLLHNAAGLFSRTPMTTDDISYLCLPLHHIYAGVAHFLYTIISGMQIYLGSGTDHILTELLAVRPSVFCAVPLILNRIYENASETVWEMLRNIRYLYCGGSFLDPQIKQAFLRHGVTLLEAYGMTETASVVALADPEDDNTDCNGKILDGVDVRIIHADADGVGEIIVGGANVSSGYLYSNGTYREFDSDGFYHTGDLGTIDNSRHLYLKGRKKRLILTSNGKNIYIDELEQLIAEHPLIQSAVVFEEQFHPAARIYTSLSESDTRKYIDEINSRLPRYKQIQTIYRLPEKKEGRIK